MQQCRILRGWCGLFLLITTLWLAQASAETPAALKGTPAFYTTQTIAWLGHTQVIPFRLDSPASEDHTFTAISSSSDIVEIIRPPAILKGETIGYLRVRARKSGSTTLTLGAAKLVVDVRKSTVDTAGFDPRPAIVSPARGAAVWGTINIGVEVFDDPSDQAAPSPVTLVLPTGKTLTESRDPSVGSPPLRRAVFRVNTDDLPAGAGQFVARITARDGTVLESTPLVLNIIKPAANDVISDECEKYLEPARPLRPGMHNLRVGSDPSASGKRFVACPGTEPVWSYPFEVKEDGLYQVMMTARGDFGAGTFPSLGVTFGESDRAVTASRLVDHRWQRTPIGYPVELKTGKVFLGVKFLNDFYAPDNYDRNLYLDRFEIVKVQSLAKDAPAPPAGGMAMVPAMAMAMAKAPGTYEASDDFRVALLRPVHGLSLRGDLTLTGLAWWRQAATVTPPRMWIAINGTPLMEQRTADPVFRISTGYFKPGRNALQLIGELDNGLRAVSPTEYIDVNESITGNKPRAYYRFGMTDPAWGASLKDKLTSLKHQDGHMLALFAGESEATLTLPEDLAGTFEVYLDARGDQYEGFPIVAAKLRTGGVDKPIAEKTTNQWFNDWKVGNVELTKGPKQLVVSFINDAYKEKVGDRNLWLRAVSLREVAGADSAPPSLEIIYPRNGQHVGLADAVVVDARDDDAFAWIDLVVDGRRLGMNAPLDPALGRIVFPLLCRNLPPGEHHVKVRGEDRSGNQGDSEEITFIVNAATQGNTSELTPYESAVRLLNRFGLGPDPEELAAVLVMGERAYLEDRLSRGASDPGEMAATNKARTVFSGSDGGYDIAVNTIHQLQLTPNPVRARFVMWAENHFSTWLRKTEGWRKWQEHEAFMKAGVAPFVDLLVTSATSPAMLVYLDQQRSFATKLNENYSREIMELHTLGVHGGYTQADVTSLAGLLNGWTAMDEADTGGRGYPLESVYRYDGTLNDGLPRRILGMSYEPALPAQRFDRVRLALETLAAHPSTAEFICRKLAEHYVSDPAPEAMVTDLTRVYHQTGGDMKSVLLAMAEHPQFRRADLPMKVARPIDFALRLSRVTRADDSWTIHNFLQSSGMGLFDCITPNGYPEADDRYADSNAVLQRWKLVRTWDWRMASLVPGTWRWSVKSDPVSGAQNIVDAVAVALTGRVLGPESNAAALRVLAEATGDIGSKTQQTAVFVGMLPEANMR